MCSNSVGGRPSHSYWNEGKFEKRVTDKGKLIAFCLLCKKPLQNTAEARLRTHR